MKKEVAFLLFVSTMFFVSCNNDNPEINIKTEKKVEEFTFSSSDTTLVKSFNWAKKQALSYVGDSNDLVGPWYEGALPEREAFCMRDISHQCLGGEYLGLHNENLNMMKHFVENIAESRDWCSYWEINRYNKPAPVDYKNDEEFWYNLPANFDVIQACYRLYKISGDETYIKDSTFLSFYEKSLNEYIERWQLDVSQFANRKKYLNVKEPVQTNNPFHYARGLASYVEGGKDLKIGADLIGAIYAGFNTYANILEINGDLEKASEYRAKSEVYKNTLESKWWDEKDNSYFSYVTYNNEYYYKEPATFLLWFDVLSDENRISGVLNELEKKTYNIENTSYLPYLQYKYGRKDVAYRNINFLANPSTSRREYPEVSFGVVQAVVDGLMGVNIDYSTNIISVKPALSVETKWAKIERLPIGNNTLSVKHYGNHKSEIQFNNKSKIKLKVIFNSSEYNTILVNGAKVNAVVDGDSIYTIINNIDDKLITVQAK
jgi:hypothetical protein